MSIESVRPLDPETLELFSSKGVESGARATHAGDANAVKVRRVLQIVRDLGGTAGGAPRILDVACGEGVYAIEAALRGAEVLALDARTERMQKGSRAAERLGLANVRFEQNDVRQISAASHGQFDIILFLGILYHLDVPDVFQVVENLHRMCRRMVIIDTHVCLHPRREVEHKGRVYQGCEYREHLDHDPEPIRRGRLLASLDNTLSFWFTRKSLIGLLRDTGFTSILECHAPLEALKPDDRVTLVALKGTPVRLSAYPWVNDKSEAEIERTLRAIEARQESMAPRERASAREKLRHLVNRMLRPLGCEINRV
jgi:SAM-dependent methyltransferase